MMISDRQAALALRYLRNHQTLERERRASSKACVSPAFLAVVKRRIAQLPETRDDRVMAAWEVLEGDVPSRAVAEKMIGRLICDEIS